MKTFFASNTLVFVACSSCFFRLVSAAQEPEKILVAAIQALNSDLAVFEGLVDPAAQANIYEDLHSVRDRPIWTKVLPKPAPSPSYPRPGGASVGGGGPGGDIRGTPGLSERPTGYPPGVVPPSTAAEGQSQWRGPPGTSKPDQKPEVPDATSNQGQGRETASATASPTSQSQHNGNQPSESDGNDERINTQSATSEATCATIGLVGMLVFVVLWF